jgi:O-antigen/teichoic acid export membrane protein
MTPAGTNAAAAVREPPVGARVVRNYSFLAFSYAASRLLLFVAMVYFARVLGAEHFGRISLAQTLMLAFTLLTHLGLMTLGTREVARHPQRIGEHVGNILGLRGVLATGSFLLMLGVAAVAPVSSSGKLLIALFGLSLFPTALLLDWSFKGVQRMGVVGWIEMLRAAPFLALVLLWVRDPGDVLLVPVFFLASTSVAAAIGLGIFVRDYGWPRIRLNLAAWRESLRLALPLGIAFILLQAFYLVDTILLGFLRGEVYVGWYSAAYKIAAFLLGMGGWYFETTFPVVAGRFHHAPATLPQLLDASTRLTTALTVPLAVGGVLLAEPAIVSFYGPEYAVAALPLQLLVVAVAVELTGMNFGYGLMACDRSKKYLSTVLVAGVLSVGLNLALIPMFGLAGAGSVRLFCSILMTTFFYVQFRRTVPCHGARHLLKPLAASAVMAAAVLLLLDQHWGIRALMGASVYGVILLLISTPDRELLVNLLRGTQRRPEDGAPAASTFTENASRS